MKRDIPEDKLKKVRAFTKMGISFSQLSSDGSQLIGYCPFSDKENKFYVNPETLLWDSKSAGESGNLYDFLDAMCELNRADLGQKELERIAQDRKLPAEAFKDPALGIGWDGLEYTIPVRDMKHRVVDVRRWKPGKPAMSLPGCQTWLLFAEDLFEADAKTPIYLCEGEWDAIALRWLLAKLKEPGVVIGVPGAGTFKLEWSSLFDRRDVVVCYDNDEPGRTGAQLVQRRLQGIARSVRHIWWRSEEPDGWDIRDWVVHGAIVKGTPRKCWETLIALAKPGERPLQGKAEQGLEPAEEAKKADKPKRRLTHRDLFFEFSKWLHMRSEEALAVAFGALFANRIDGDPLWLLLVAPPGGMKSELLMSLMTCEETYHVSSLTPHALVSGMNLAGGQDPSLMPKINNKTLVIKDFTAILTLHPTARDEIFGQLRDSYDGHFEKLFGNGVLRRYASKFGILAGVTPAIDAYSAMHSGLGERFLKYRMDAGMDAADERSRILRALNNTGNETRMREALQEAADAFVASVSDRVPELEPGMDVQIAELGMITARLRGVVNRERYMASIMANKAGYEIATRVCKQLTKLAKGIAMYLGHETAGKETLPVLASVALASVPDKVEEVVRALTLAGADAPTKDVIDRCQRISRATVVRVLQDLEMLGLVKREVVSGNSFWSLDGSFKLLVDSSQAFELRERAAVPHAKLVVLRKQKTGRGLRKVVVKHGKGKK